MRRRLRQARVQALRDLLPLVRSCSLPQVQVPSEMLGNLRAARSPGDTVSGPMEGDDCASCGEEMPRNECPKSKRPCGHHCNHAWTHDVCDWCGQEFGEETTP